MRLKIDQEQIDIMNKFLDEITDIVYAYQEYNHNIDYSNLKGIIYTYQDKLDRLEYQTTNNK